MTGVDAGKDGSVTVVVGYVDSVEGRAALDVAIEECRLRGAALVLVPMSERDVPADTGDHGGVRTTVAPPAPERGDTTEHLLQTARGADARLLVIGLRRRSTVGKLILGSHAQRVLLGASCPVLTVTTDGDAPDR